MNLTISICNRWKGTDLVTKSSRCFLFQEFTQIEACAAMAVEKEEAEAGEQFSSWNSNSGAVGVLVAS